MLPGGGPTTWYLEPGEIQRHLDVFREHYNLRRSHQGYRLGGRTPARTLREALAIDDELPPLTGGFICVGGIGGDRHGRGVVIRGSDVGELPTQYTPARVLLFSGLGIEAVPRYLEQAKLVRDALHLDIDLRGLSLW